MNFRGKRNGINLNFTAALSPGYGKIEKLRAGVQWYQWYMMETKDFISNNMFKSKNKNGSILCFNQ